MRHAVLAAALAFRTPLTVSGSPVPPAAQRVASAVLAWLDRRRARIDADITAE